MSWKTNTNCEPAGLVTAEALNRPPRRDWLHWYKYPLLPVFEYVPANERNAAQLSFHWLFFRLITMMLPMLAIGIEVNEAGIYVKMQLPYLLIHICVLPFPDFFLGWSMDHLWRTGMGKR